MSERTKHDVWPVVEAAAASRAPVPGAVGNRLPGRRGVARYGASEPCLGGSAAGS